MPFLFFAAAFVATYFVAKKMNEAPAPGPKQLPQGPPQPQIKPQPAPGDTVAFPVPGTGGYGIPGGMPQESWKPSIGDYGLPTGMPQPKFLQAQYVAEPTGVPASYFVHVFGQPLSGKITTINMDSALGPSDPAPPGTVGYGRVASIVVSVGDTSGLSIEPGTLVFVLAPKIAPGMGGMGSF